MGFHCIGSGWIFAVHETPEWLHGLENVNRALYWHMDEQQMKFQFWKNYPFKWALENEQIMSLPSPGAEPCFVFTSDAATLSSRGVGGLFCAGSLRPTVLSLFMLGGLAVKQEVIS